MEVALTPNVFPFFFVKKTVYTGKI